MICSIIGVQLSQRLSTHDLKQKLRIQHMYKKNIGTD